MKATDLMIGDWVKSRTGMNVKIVGINHDYPSEYESITLTPEILEANNFKRIIMKNYTDSSCFGVFGECFYYDIKGLGIDIRTSYERIDVRGGFSLIQVRNKKNYACVENLDYVQVHELQHALRLCGLDKLANNFKIE